MKKSSLIKLEKTPWDWGNSVLYDMCKSNPGHNNESKALGKIWIIGRSYSAAIERGAGKHRDESKDFYAEKVGPMLARSDIDKWIKKLTKIGRITESNIEILLEIHAEFVEEIHGITDKKKRSLASKYLHFHAPESVFIYDSIANKEIRSLLREETPRFSYKKGYDDTYSQFVTRCLYLRDEIIEPRMKKKITPRFLDKVLLSSANGQL